MATVYFVTNRNPNRRKNPDGFTGELSQEGAFNLRYGCAQVDVASGSVKVAVEPEANRSDPHRGSVKIARDIQAEMAQGQDTLAFIHGFNVSFRDALLAGARLRETYDRIVVVFTWPSDGRKVPWASYWSDRDDAKASAPAVARAFLKLVAFLQSIPRERACRQQVHLMAHSMGNYVLRNGLQKIRQEYPDSLPRVFGHIFLMAADEDNDAFEVEHKLLSLPQLGRAVNVYFNHGDTALVVSDKTKFNLDRLGATGPRLPHGVPRNVTLIDASHVAGEGDPFQHAYYWMSPSVVTDVRQVLNGTLPDQVSGRHYVPSLNHYTIQAP